MSAGREVCARCGWAATHVARFTIGTVNDPTTIIEQLCTRHARAVRKVWPRKLCKITKLQPKETVR